MADQSGDTPFPIPPIRVDEGDRLGALQFMPPLLHGGHCLFTAGTASAGKSTLQHALIHRLFTDERINLTFRNEEGGTHHDPDLQEWILRFDRGEFPDRTKGNLQTFFIEFGQYGRPVKLSFVEISGEHFQAILPRLPRPGQPVHIPQLAPELEYILTTKTVKKLFIFVADATRPDPAITSNVSSDERDQALFEDILFSSLLSRIRELGLSRIMLLFAATKWDAGPNPNLDPEQFFRAHFPQTRAKLRSFPKAHVQYIRFTIGNVRTRDETSAHQSRGQEIVKRDFTPIELVIQWIHTHATGRTLRGYPSIRPTLWERIKGWAAA